MKRTFVVPDEKEVVYEKFKALVPEVSRKLVELMEDYVIREEGLDAQMEELKIYEGADYTLDNIFDGDEIRFWGVLIAEDITSDNELTQVSKKIYLTKKRKFLVSIQTTVKNEAKYVYSYEQPYDSYFDMKKKTDMTNILIEQCEAYLSKNSTIRTYKVLDV